MTFVIKMIGDSYPLPAGQTTFVSALQVGHTPSCSAPATAPTEFFPHYNSFHTTAVSLTLPGSTLHPCSVHTPPRLRLAPSSRSRSARSWPCPGQHAHGYTPPQAFNFLRVVRLIKVQHLLRRYFSPFLPYRDSRGRRRTKTRAYARGARRCSAPRPWEMRPHPVPPDPARPSPAAASWPRQLSR